MSEYKVPPYFGHHSCLGRADGGAAAGGCHADGQRLRCDLHIVHRHELRERPRRHRHRHTQRDHEDHSRLSNVLRRRPRLSLHRHERRGDGDNAGQVLAPGRFTFHLSVGRFKVVRHSAAGLAVAKITEEIPSRRKRILLCGVKNLWGVKTFQYGEFQSALIRSTVRGQNPGVKKCHSGVKTGIN